MPTDYSRLDPRVQFQQGHQVATDRDCTYITKEGEGVYSVCPETATHTVAEYLAAGWHEATAAEVTAYMEALGYDGRHQGLPGARPLPVDCNTPPTARWRGL